jgi:uncharacterized protein YecT (DUF1311 family)
MLLAMTVGPTATRLATIALLYLLLTPTIAARAENCGDLATQSAMNACADAELRASDAQLNATYNGIINRLRGLPTSRERLVASETAWFRFRDAECSFASSATDGGSVQPMIVATCKTALTKDRQKQLAAYLHSQEGDLSCPVPPN